MEEAKRRTKVIEVFPDPEACSKVVHLVAQEMNGKYSRRAALEFYSVKDELGKNTVLLRPYLKSYVW